MNVRRLERENAQSLLVFFFSHPLLFAPVTIKAGIHLKAVFTPPKIGLTEISRSRFKQYKNPTLITQTNVLGCFVNFLVIFRYIWEEIVFLKRVVKFGEIRNSSDLMSFKN